MEGRRSSRGPDPHRPQVRPGDVPPPHSPEAEVALLGTILVDATTFAVAAEHLTADDFFAPANQRVYAAMQRLFETGAGIDPVTVANALRNVGELDSTGGMAHLAGMVGQAAAPAAAEQHALIVRDRALVRRMIGAASTVVSEGYSNELSPQEYLERAESLVFKAGEARVRGAIKSLDESLDGALERIQYQFDNRSHTTGIPTGYRFLDGMLSGLQPSDLVIIAARPSMGKTSFALNLALNAARTDPTHHVLFASLEMSEPQITDRLLCIQALVDAGRVRRGYLAGAELQHLKETRELLRGTPLYIDDSPKLSVLELRAKARRMKWQGRLDMVMVDYLQLMDPSDKKVSREQQISEISRSLKALAKELKIPVIALSQLSRAPEQRPGKDKRPILSDLRECVTGDTLACLADGRRVPIRDLVGTTPDVVAVGLDGRLVTARSDKVWPVGVRTVYRVRLASGREVRATADHRLRSWDGWCRVGELAVGERLATARRMPEPRDAIEWPEARVALLGHLVGDGSYPVHRPLRYTTASEDNSRLVADAARDEFGATVTRHAGRGNWHQLVISGNGNRWHPAGVGKWLKDLGIHGQRSHDKRLPADVFRFTDRQVGLLLRHLWATDGTIHVRRAGSRGESSVAFSTCSEGLARDVSALLLRLGIGSRMRSVQQGLHRPMFVVAVSGSTEQRRFLERVGAFGPRALPAAILADRLAGVEAATNVDTLPMEAWTEVRQRMVANGISQRTMAALRNTSCGGTSHFRFAPSRATYASYAVALGDPSLGDRVHEELFWDRVVAVDPAGDEEVFDLTVPGPSCWLADGIVSHNSGAIEQDADVVMFLYRPEYYERENVKEEDKNVLEIIIAKQRNGPTGTVRLTFRRETMTVADRDEQPLNG